METNMNVKTLADHVQLEAVKAKENLERVKLSGNEKIILETENHIVNELAGFFGYPDIWLGVFNSDPNMVKKLLEEFTSDDEGVDELSVGCPFCETPCLSCNCDGPEER